MDRVKAFAAVLPALAIYAVSSWLDLFVHTRLAYPNWAIEAEQISLGAGAFVAIIICFADADKSRTRIRSHASVITILAIAGIFACLLIYVLLGRGFVNSQAGLLQYIWFFVFIATMTLVIAAIAEASLLLKHERSAIFWAIVVVAGIVLIIAISIYLFGILWGSQ